MSEITPTIQALSGEQLPKNGEVPEAASDAPRDDTPTVDDVPQESADEPVDEKAEGDKTNAERQKKKTPYFNPDRHKTGGPQREKPSADELAERMEKIRIRNDEIKQRRIAVQADEEAFKATQEQERAKQAASRKTQESINRNRDENARRKMEKIAHREWDNGKNTRERNVKNTSGRKPDTEGAGKAEGGKGRKTPIAGAKDGVDEGHTAQALQSTVESTCAETGAS